MYMNVWCWRTFYIKVGVLFLMAPYFSIYVFCYLFLNRHFCAAEHWGVNSRWCYRHFLRRLRRSLGEVPWVFGRRVRWCASADPPPSDGLLDGSLSYFFFRFSYFFVLMGVVPVHCSYFFGSFSLRFFLILGVGVLSCFFVFSSITLRSFNIFVR